MRGKGLSGGRYLVQSLTKVFGMGSAVEKSEPSRLSGEKKCITQTTDSRQR